jgi:tungstate transport system ATP-binding protein
MRDNLDIAAHASWTILHLDGVIVSAGATTMLDQVSLELRTGAPTAIIGPNGAGKTTLLRVAMGLVAPAAGSIEIAAAARAIVFQKPVMLRRTVAENVAFALRPSCSYCIARFSWAR